MLYLIPALLLITFIFGPQFWAQYTFHRYAKPLSRIPGTGAELARHLLDRFEMGHVKVEVAQATGDHYDPDGKTVRLSKSNYENNSLTAIAVAAHEVGHAIQHHKGEKMLALRSKLVTSTNRIQKLGTTAVLLMPIIILISHNPRFGIVMLILGVASMFLGTLVHLVTLPVEIDASFGKALPILIKGGYIENEDERVVRSILKAAALTYLAASLASLLNFWRWLAVFRR
ncbi:MAG: zinc metallopeptidase [Gammaproteobacteria bacterium]|nr:zinc metallopeptidase [Gammaproteobacteria bacterium]